MTQSTVQGTDGDDVIGPGYDGDPAGGRVDDGDAPNGSDDDVILGLDGNDVILAGEGNDTAFGGAGDDILLGQSGDDSLFGGAGHDQIDGGDGDDAIWGDDPALPGGGNDTLTGGDGADVIHGGAGDDRLYGGDGDDSLYGGDGDDHAEGGEGRDQLSGGAGDDTLGGNAGDDVIFGEDGDDRLDGGAGDDRLYGGAGIDSIEGGLGNDIVYGGDGDDSINGAEGSDEVYGGAGNDTVRGSFGNDTVGGGTGDNFVWGGYGDDVIVVENGFGNDFYKGDSLEEVHGDTLDLSRVTDNLTIDLRQGDRSHGYISDGVSRGEFVEIEHIVLGAGADTLLLADGGGDDAVIGFAAPVQNPDGSWSAVDRLDVAGLHITDLSRAVHTGDVQVLDDGDGNALLQFPNMVSLTLVGVPPAAVSPPGALAAMGIPAGPDGTILGTDGDDVIDGDYDQDPNGDRVDNNDAPDGSNDDWIKAGEGNDTVYGGAGDDTIDGGLGDNVLYGGAGNDVIIAMGDSDLIYGGDGDDVAVVGANPEGVADLFGGDGIDRFDATSVTVDMELDLYNLHAGGGGGYSIGRAGGELQGFERYSLGSGNDWAAGSDRGESIHGGAGDDMLQGMGGGDVLDGGDGDDWIWGWAGDTIHGGDGDDLIVLFPNSETASDDMTVYGGAGYDTLDLSGDLYRTDRVTITSDGPNGKSGHVTLSNGSLLTFHEIENIICFTPGARIATPKGARPVETLAVGDLVVTRDHGLQPIRWIGRRRVPGTGGFAPIRIRPGVLPGQENDLLVSPQHRMLFRGYRAELLFGENEVLIAAKHLVDGKLVTEDPVEEVEYIHILFDQHEIIYAESAPTESFCPGEIGLSAVTDAAREEIFAIFPELRSMPGRGARAARRSLRRQEADLLRA